MAINASVVWLELEDALVKRGLVRGQARDLIWAGLQSKSLQVAVPARMVENQELSGTIPDDLIVCSVRQTLAQRVVATLPISQPDTSIPPTLQVFRQVIAAAHHTLAIASPYLDYEGVEKIGDAIFAAASRGVRIRVLTRETEARQRGRERGLAQLSRLAAPSLEVRDYHTPTSRLGHYTSLHAKILLADASVAYVGSAEVRGNALEKNFEIGAVLWQDEVLEVTAAFEAVWTVARPVDLSSQKL